MKLFLSGTSFAPSYGGPALTVARLARELAAQSVEVGVWAPDGTAGLLQPAASAQQGLRVLTGDLASAWESFGPADLIHDNGLWWTHNHQLASLARRFRVPRIVSTRGMQQPWCFRHKRWKKALGWQLYQRRDLQQAAALHVTSQAEVDAAERLGLRPPAVLIANGVDLPSLIPVQEAPPQHPLGTGGTALFLGRLYPVKGIDLLLNAWAQVRPPGWQLRVAGPDEAGHQAELQSLVLDLDLSGCITFIGPVGTAEKSQELLNADLLILPSRSESFGVVVAEALAHQTPVLTTTATPWSQLEAIGAGWLCEPEVGSLAKGLSRALATSAPVRKRMGAAGRSFVEQSFSWESCAREFLDLYASVRNITL